MSTRPKTTQEKQEYDLVVTLFHKLENNTMPNLSKESGLSYAKVNKIINEYLEKKIDKMGKSVKDIVVYGAIQIKPNGGFVAY